MPSSFGETLQQLREAKRISLAEISKETKISVRFLEALEGERFDHLPGGIFNRGFVKACAKVLGADTEALLASYEAAAHRWGNEKEVASASLEAPVQVETPLPRPRWIPFAVAGLVLTTFLVVSVLVYRKQADSSKSVTEGKQSASSSVATPPSIPLSGANVTLPNAPLLPAPSESTSPEKKPPSAREASVATAEEAPRPRAAPTVVTAVPGTRELKLQIFASQKAWISIMADGRRVMERIVFPRETLRFTAQGQIEMICGNAGGVEVSFNGAPQPPLGKPGEVRQITYKLP